MPKSSRLESSRRFACMPSFGQGDSGRCQAGQGALALERAAPGGQPQAVLHEPRGLELQQAPADCRQDTVSDQKCARPYMSPVHLMHMDSSVLRNAQKCVRLYMSPVHLMRVISSVLRNAQSCGLEPQHSSAAAGSNQTHCDERGELSRAAKQARVQKGDMLRGP